MGDEYEMDGAVPDISEPAASSSADAAGSSTASAEDGIAPSVPPPAALGRYESTEANEVNTIEDLHVVRSFELGPEDVPKDLSDDESSIPDDSSSVASEAMDDAPPEPEPPAEDHSVQQLTIHTEPVYSVAVNAARPELLATGGGDDVGYLWHAGQSQPIGKLEGHTDTIAALGFSADGTLLASAGLDGAIRVWDVVNGKLVVALEGPTQGINWLCWHARGAVLLAGSEDATAWMWKLPEGTVMQIFSAHSASVSYGGFVNNGKNVITASEDGTVRVWNPRTGTVDHCLHTTGHAHATEPRPVTSLCGHATQPVFLFGIDDGGLKVRTCTEVANAPPYLPCPPNRRAMTKKHQMGISPKPGHHSARVEKPIILAPSAAAPSCLAPCARPTPPACLTCPALPCAHSLQQLAHAESGKLLATLPGHDASVESVGFCDCMDLCASAAMDGKLCIWDLGSLAQRHTCTHMAGVVELRWLKGSPMLLTCAVSRELKLWDGRSGACLQTLTGHHAAVLCLDIGYTANGIFVVSGSDDKTARLWQPRLA